MSGDANGGDSVVYRRVEAYLRERCALTVLEMQPAGRLGQLMGAAKGLPLEPARYLTPENQAVLDKAIRSGSAATVIYGHEAVFALGLRAPRAGRRIFYAHNVQSGVTATGDTLFDRIIAPAAVRFDRAWSADSRDRLICISHHDVASLRRIGVSRDDILMAPPGAPPSVPFGTDPRIIPEPVLTGSYGWWRKRRDLARFAAEPAMPWPLLVSDTTALEILGDQAVQIDPKAIDWSAGLRPALVTDRFLGGFKLKALEYVALNCTVFSYCDLRLEFSGLPHAEEFVRVIGSKAEFSSAISLLLTQPPVPLLQRFRAFKDACLDRYAWGRCLAPLEDILDD